MNEYICLVLLETTENYLIMKKHILLVLSFFLLSIGFGQVVIYNEDFDGALTWTLNTDAAAEGTNPNIWYISCEEEGVGAGLCGTACGAGNQTLHVSTNIADLGAAYAETGLGATTTNRRAESGAISTVGDVDLTLSFDLIGQGGGTDFCEVFYSIDGGGAWTSIATPLTSMCCGGVPCTGTEQGLWQNNTYTLPTECEGVADLRISFVWQNLDDGVATDPSFAVDNIQITKPPVVVPGGPTALFDPEDITICQGESITYTDMSITGDVISDWNWVFGGGSPGSALTAGPHVVTYPTPGVYMTTLTVTDGIGSHDTTFTVTVEDGPYAGEPAAADLCEGETLDLNTLIPGADAGGTWTETSGAPSGTFTAGTGVLDGTGLTVGDVFTFDYETAAGAPPCPGTDIATITITIIACDALNASFTPSSEEICLNDCITFTDGSTGAGITGWAWTFSDPAIGGPLTGADPGSVCFPTAGDIDVTLTVTDGVTFDDTTITIRVNPLPTVTAIASTATTVCEGTTIVLSGTGDALGYNWDMGVTDGEAFVINETTTFTVTGFNNFACEDTDEITITVVPCEPLLPGFSFDDIICVGDCITFTDTSQGDPISHAWDFGGGGEPAASTDQNPTICFNTAGIFDIQLTVTNELGESASTTNSITVFASPMVTAEQDTVIDLGGTAALVATGGIPEGSYVWEPDDYINCETCDLTSANPPTTTTYQVTLTDVNGCTATDTVVVYVNFERALGVPDAFTPNGDGFNDVLYVRGFGLEAIKFSVYNKYGEKVFESLTQDIGWDGKFRGKEENPGVFTWVVEYEFIDGNSGSRKGTTTLIR